MRLLSSDAFARDRATRFGLHFLVSYGILPIIIILMYIVFGLIEPNFHSAGTALNVLKQTSYLAIFATGQMFALLTRGFDLSVGQMTSMISVSSALVLMSMVNNYPNSIALAVFVACAAGLGIGLAIGTLNGICVAVFRINPFVVTLGVQGICLGFATTLSDGFPVFNLPRPFTNAFATSSWLGIPAPIAVCLIVLVVVHMLLNHTVLGRTVYMLGGNPRAAFVAGRSSRVYLVSAYVICSLIVAVGAILLTARAGSGEPNIGGGLMLQSIAAGVIGGVSLRGGEGRVIHVVFGALFVTVFSVGMNLARIDGYIQQMILGAVVVAAVYFDNLRMRIR